MKQSMLRTLSLSIGLFATVSLNAQSSHSTHGTAATPFAADPSPAVHGMVLFGTDQLFVSHIPMYMTPHDYQALVKVKVSAEGLAAYAKYNKDGQQYFTLAPKPFVLPKLLDGRLVSFKADLYRGSFEQGGRVIARNITVTVDEVAYVSKLSKTTPASAALTYLTLNDGVNSFLAHKITSPNNFDQIVQIKWLNDTVPGQAFARSFQASDRITNRLAAGQLFTISEDGTISEAESVETASFEVVSAFYCTQGPDFYNTCD